MTNEKQLNRVLEKAKRLCEVYEQRLFTPLAEVEMEARECMEHLYTPPADGYHPIRKGDTWGVEWGSLWLRGDFVVPEEMAGKPLYVLPRLGGWEGFLYLNGMPHAIFTNKYTIGTHGNHYAARITPGAAAGERLHMDFEYYAGHNIPGCAPFEDSGLKDFTHVYESVMIAERDEELVQFVFDLYTLNSLAGALPENSFRRGDIILCLYDVVLMCATAPDDADEWRSGITAAIERMRPVLDEKNSASAPVAAAIGHSHMDTAWLWPVSETVRKCARTYANAVRLMDEYPEYKFFQSSAYHSEVIRRHYPELFEKIREKIAEGRYEPGGAVYIECDCNMVSGESMIRQFLWGQKYNEKHFGLRANNFWLPDTFGYSAAIPQIMRGCGTRYFFTTKLSWNDTNVFPYDTFWWEGIDGSRVFTHFNMTHYSPDPDALLRYTFGGRPDFTQDIKWKHVNRRKVMAYGKGDGGGGPQFEEIEMARRVRDLEGCPRCEHKLVGEFAREIEAEAKDVPVYAGELYLELHRGTLTNKHEIKRNNRKAEVALHDLEMLTVLDAVDRGIAVSDEAIVPHTETLLVNQFHDILPGSCIERAHRESIAQMHEMIDAVHTLQGETVAAQAGEGFTLVNTLSFSRRDTVYLPGTLPCGQHVTDVYGNELTAVEGIEQAPMSAMEIDPNAIAPMTGESFCVDGDRLETPFYTIVWDEKGGFASLIDKRCSRELRKGLPLGTLLLAEDVPSNWDNWDIDADMVYSRFRPTAKLLERTIVSQGASEIRYRCHYQLTSRSTLVQDVIFYANRPEIVFQARVDWNDKHHFLKVAFDTSIHTRTATHEIQYGQISRPTTRNTSYEQAMFEVCNHKYTDLSEPRYGCAVLNDCKYGVSVDGGSIRLSLHKSGCRPDVSGDSGVHDFTYAFLPHMDALKAENVVRAGYCLNYPTLVFAGSRKMPDAPLIIDEPNLIVEMIKPLHESDEKAFVIRAYECEGAHTVGHLTFAPYITEAHEANMLEEIEGEALTSEAELTFKPFEIKTFVVRYV